MSAREDAEQPTPAMMPRRRTVIPPAPRPSSRAAFQVATSAPRRGWPDAIVWPDTGVLLGLGTDQTLLDRFRAHYGGRVRVVRGVDREIRSHSLDNLAPNAADEDRARVAAATRVVQAFLIGPGVWPVVELSMADLTDVDTVREQLRALSDDPGRKHGGEAEIIVLASRAAASDGNRHVLLANDGPASVVAHRRGIPTRHIGDVLAEFACADPELSADQCLAACLLAMTVSKPRLAVVPLVVKRSHAAELRLSVSSAIAPSYIAGVLAVDRVWVCPALFN